MQIPSELHLSNIVLVVCSFCKIFLILFYLKEVTVLYIPIDLADFLYFLITDGVILHDATFGVTVELLLPGTGSGVVLEILAVFA